MESKFSFIDYAREIYEASKANGVPTDIGYDMFRKDVENGYNANCGPALDGFDFVEPKLNWQKLSRGDQDEARAEWRAFAGRAFNDLSNAFTAGDRAAFDAAVEKHRYPEEEAE